MSNTKAFIGFLLVGFLLVALATAPSIAQESSSQGRPPILISNNGDTNQLIVRLDLDDNAVTQRATGRLEYFSSRSLAEEAVVGAVNARVPEVISYFAGPVEAWHLISEERLDDVARDFLGHL